MATVSSVHFAARPLSKERVFCWRWRPHRPAALLLAALLSLLLLVQPVMAQQPATPAVERAALQAAVDWLLTQQDAGGGFTGFSGEPDAGTTIDAILALTAARQAGANVHLQPALDFLLAEDHALVYAQTGAGQAAKLVLTAIASGINPRSVAGVDPVSLAAAGVNDDTGFYGNGAYDHALVMLALAAAGEEVSDEAVSRLVDAQQRSGAWAFDGSELEGSGDTNTTAIAIQAMAAAGQGRGRDVRQALEYLRCAQNGSGGFPYQPSTAECPGSSSTPPAIDTAPPDANSTALVVQALIAAEQDPSSPGWRNALGALMAFQNDSGAFRYMDDMPDDNLYATLQAIPAIAGVAFSATALPKPATPIAA